MSQHDLIVVYWAMNFICILDKKKKKTDRSFAQNWEHSIYTLHIRPNGSWLSRRNGDRMIEMVSLAWAIKMLKRLVCLQNGSWSSRRNGIG